MAILLTGTWSAAPVSTDDVPRYLDAFVETLLYQRNQPYKLRFLLRRKEDMTVLQAAIPSLSKSDRWEAAVLNDLGDVKTIGRVLDGVRIVVWADNGREMSITSSGATLFRTVAAMELRHLVYHSQVQTGGGSQAVREAVDELKEAPYEGKHKGLRCSVIESTPLFHLPVSKASTSEQIIFTLSSRHHSSSHSSLHSLAQSVVGIVLAGGGDAYPTYELVSRHHSFEGIGNVYFSGSSPRRRNTSSKSRVEGQKRMARQSEPKLDIRFAQDDKLHEAWLSFYPSQTRSGRRPRLNLLSCVPCCSSSSGMMKSEYDDDNEEVCRTLVSPTSPPNSAETKLGVEDEKYGNISIDSTEKLAPVETPRRGPVVPMSLAQAGRVVSTSSEGCANIPGSPRRPEALTNVSFLRAGPWKLNLPEEVGDGRAR